MEKKNCDRELNRLIRESMELKDAPSPELNRYLKARLCQREAAMRQEADLHREAAMRREADLHREAAIRQEADLYREGVISQEAVMGKKASIRMIPLWFVPMLLNLITFALLSALGLLCIANPYLAGLAAGICAYMGLGGILITLVGVKRTDMKETVSVYLRKRSA